MALPLATTARSCSSGGTTCAECRSVGVNTCARPSRAARMSLERLSRSDTTAEGNLQPKSQPNNAGKPHDSHQNRVPIEVLLRDPGPGQGRGDAAAEQDRKSTRLNSSH